MRASVSNHVLLIFRRPGLILQSSSLVREKASFLYSSFPERTGREIAGFAVQAKATVSQQACFRKGEFLAR
jgi:hypothetical protein